MRSSTRFALVACLLACGFPAAANVPVEGGSLQGQIFLAVDAADAGAFGLGPGEATLFIAQFEILLDDPPPAGQSLPDGEFTGRFTRFDVTIGNTSWDEAMPHTTPIVRIVGGLGAELSNDFTRTRPTHPDFRLFFSDPVAGVEARWLAFDEVDGIDNGSLMGTYVMETIAGVPALSATGVVLVVGAMIGLAMTPVMRLEQRERSERPIAG